MSDDKRFRTKDHPEANGRTPQAGEQQWSFWFPLDDGTKLYLSMGKEGRDNLRSLVMQEEADDLLGRSGFGQEGRDERR